MAGSSGIKRGIPNEPDGQYKVHGKSVKVLGNSNDLEDNVKRCNLVVNILHTVLLPALRRYVEPRLDQLYQTLKTSHSIDTQAYPHYLKCYFNKFLNYEAINNNRAVPGQFMIYEYCVKNSIDLSKLFLPTFMANYLDFEEGCDLVTLLRIIMNTGISPPDGIVSAAKIESEVRSTWRQGDLRVWTNAKCTESLNLMKMFIQHLEFPAEEETDILAQFDQISQPESYPRTISRMDEASRKLYKKVLESGYETKREIQVLVIGKDGEDKRRLIGYLQAETDTNDRKILKDDDDSPWNGKNVKAEDKNLLNVDGQPKHRTVQSTQSLEAIETDTHHGNEENIDQDIKDVNNSKVKEEDDIRISVRDFGRDIEFYYTHQLFNAEDAVFLILISLGDSAVCSNEELKFWFETIHCLSRDPDYYELKPRCIVLGINKDLQLDEETAYQVLGRKLQSVPDALRKHIYGQRFLISNIESNDQPINSIKTAIVKAAKESTEWEERKHPLKFILLDNALEKKRRERDPLPVMTRSDFLAINEGLHLPLSADELELYLRYTHLSRQFVCYEDLPDYIIISSHWLGDFFRSFVTGDEYRLSKLPKRDLKKLRSTGQITATLLQEILKINKIEVELQSYLLRVMGKFHIVLQVGSSADITKKYFAPCMVRDNDIRITSRRIKDKSTWLCLECDFLPPFLFNHIVYAFCEKYLLVSGFHSFFSNGAVFYISSNECEQLVLLRHENVIQLQILMFDEGEVRNYCEIKAFLTKQIKDCTRAYSLTIRYKYKWKCPESTNSYSGLMELNACHDGEEYYCKSCNKDGGVHTYRNYWDEDAQCIPLIKPFQFTFG